MRRRARNLGGLDRGPFQQSRLGNLGVVVADQLGLARLPLRLGVVGGGFGTRCRPRSSPLGLEHGFAPHYGRLQVVGGGLGLGRGEVVILRFCRGLVLGEDGFGGFAGGCGVLLRCSRGGFLGCGAFRLVCGLGRGLGGGGLGCVARFSFGRGVFRRHHGFLCRSRGAFSLLLLCRLPVYHGFFTEESGPGLRRGGADVFLEEFCLCCL